MLSRATFESVVHYLQQPGATYRIVARKTGVSRNTVALIAGGKHPYQRPPTPEQPREVLDEVFHDDGEIGWCPNGHGRVYLPCRTCQLQQMLKNGAVPSISTVIGRPVHDGTEDDLKSQLVGRHRQRLDDMRVRKATELVEAAMAGMQRRKRSRRRAAQGQLTAGPSPLQPSSPLP